jgi:CheY-like chemotaxis protein
VNIDTKSTKRILIVDDQPRVLDVLRETLASFQHEYAYEITTTDSVADALAILQRDRFDLIVLDMGRRPSVCRPAAPDGRRRSRRILRNRSSARRSYFARGARKWAKRGAKRLTAQERSAATRKAV